MVSQVRVMGMPHVSGIDADDALSARVAGIGEPSSDLLDRALVGWERFVATLRGVTDE
ncbi:hypothetical protein J2Z77_004718 [Streptomyces avidinii]|uniref:Uncharacterized protein n=1 Tax=Streptomyces avidinii TaxID=1895 RepID=A0ABS4L9W2_STRAV|nr:hypothetical protein [Streptomyces avidinii]